MQNAISHQLIPKVTIDYVSDLPDDCVGVGVDIKPSSSCDNDEERDEHHTCNLMNQAQKVALPSKFTGLKKRGHHGRETTLKDCLLEDEENRALDVSVREKDCDTALQWIRQELSAMKEQDKSLLKQFIELRAKILRLRCLRDVSDSFSDAGSLNGSTSSLNEQGKPSPFQRLAVEKEFAMINKQSISLPSSPKVGRLTLNNNKANFLRVSHWDVGEDDR